MVLDASPAGDGRPRALASVARARRPPKASSLIGRKCSGSGQLSGAAGRRSGIRQSAADTWLGPGRAVLSDPFRRRDSGSQLEAIVREPPGRLTHRMLKLTVLGLFAGRPERLPLGVTSEMPRFRHCLRSTSRVRRHHLVEPTIATAGQSPRRAPRASRSSRAPPGHPCCPFPHVSLHLSRARYRPCQSATLASPRSSEAARQATTTAYSCLQLTDLRFPWPLIHTASRKRSTPLAPR